MGFFDNFKSKSESNTPKLKLVDKKDTVFNLAGKQIILGVDFSYSMTENDGDLTDYKTRLGYAQKQTVALAIQANKVDPDGIDLITFSSDVRTYWNTTPAKVDEAFRGGARTNTDTALVIDAAYRRHKAIGSQSTLFLLVTDGVPNDKKAVKNKIVEIAREVKSPDVFMIAVLTVGRLNQQTSDWLIELDEELEGLTNGVDIVSVQPLNGAQFDAVQAAR